ncbi:MAG: trehalose 6-phosphate phosphatase [Lentisphaeria bacterium]|jgi:trehalose 6-phosphate phosphatase
MLNLMLAPKLEKNNIALFLDFDGTLVEIASTPEAVRVENNTIDLLEDIQRGLSGAFSLVSGRHFESIASLLDVNEYICACEHGSDIVLPSPLKYLEKNILPSDTGHTVSVLKKIEYVKEEVRGFSEQHGLICEIKKTSATIHYRLHPELEGGVKNFINGFKEGGDDFSVLSGKEIVEIRFESANKGTAIENLMALPPFKNRTPLFIGDDITDEYGFSFVNNYSSVLLNGVTTYGLSYHVGDGETCAKHRLKDVAHVHQFLRGLLI